MPLGPVSASGRLSVLRLETLSSDGASLLHKAARDTVRAHRQAAPVLTQASSRATPSVAAQHELLLLPERICGCCC